MPPTFQPRKRGRGRPPAGSRPRKRQKRLDAIVDLPTPPSAPEPPRRSSRPRRAPQLLDSSPIPSLRTKRPKRSGSATKAKTKGKRWQNGKRDGLGKAKEPDWAASEAEIEGSDGDNGVWRTRLRSSGGTKLEFDEQCDENEKISGLGMQGSSSRKRRSGRRRKEISSDEGHQDTILIANNEEQGDEQEKEKAVVEVEVIPHSPVCPEPNNVFEIAEPEVGEEIDGVPLEEREEADLPIVEAPAEEVGADEKLDTPMVGDEFSTKALEGENVLRENNKALEVGDLLRENNPKPPISNGSVEMPRVKEGRRCGLCGGGVDGRPPKKLVQESTDSDNEAYEGSSASEEPNYDVWDGFGDEPGWLGRLLGPIHDRFGIARVWVHQHCAVWSPEVYFAGLGHLKNVRAALCRGRALKCSRCGRPGATIGCRVDRCPKTYHLPCSRADGCVFDHRKFLIACPDHRRLFQPQGDDYTQQIKRMKAKKLKLDLRKLSNDAMWKDLESEEKWLENRGEDEEFLKRESKRLHRDLIRIAPVYIGGSSENKLYQGWESVAGLQDVIQCMKEIVIIPLLYPEFFTNLSLTPPRGVLLHGYPGTGKTLVVRALIGACSRGDRRIAYFARKGADCLGKYVGDAERQLRLLFQVAERSQPSIIFFDEIDGLAPCRSRHQDQTHCSVVSTLLSLMDGLKSRGSVIVIGATNRPDAVDPALRRPGRFDREIYFPLPSVEDRSAILSLHTKSWPNPLSGPLLSWISIQTAGYAGADLQSLCTQAAINALKRHCALHEILSSTERISGHGRLPSLPSFVVEERDWLSALSFAPPPCSRREAGMAANDIVSSPLSRHLIPCLLEPLSLLLISFGIDERVWLPPSISRASKSIKDVIFSNLQEKRITLGLWRLHLHDLIQDLCVSNELEKTLADCGLIADQSGLLNCYMSEGSEKSQNKFGSHEYHNKLQQTSGFRTLIAGAPRSGQHHLASCLLHAFVGHIEIQKVNLATISQEGHGDVIRGLTQILSKFLHVGRCVIYMPRIDLWAIDDNDDTNVGKVVEDKLSEKSSKPSTTDVFGARKQTSEAWNSFVEQMDSLCASSTIIILATCEVQNDDLPYGVRQFFCTDFLNNHSTPLEYSIPRFFVHVDGKYNHDIVLNSSAAEVSQDIVQHFVQLVHYKSHVISSFIKSNTSPTAMGGLEGNRENMENRRTTTVLDMSAVSEQLASKTQTSCRDNQTRQGANGDQRQLSSHTSHEKIDVQYHSHQELFQRTPIRFMKGGSTSAIAMFGYQILRYPQFAELCWVTSKLKDGPCSGINGPWKGWPFNSCVMHLSKSPSKVVTGGNSNTLKDKDSGIVRGLTAVGLLAFKGVYTSVGEVSLEVREVLELLVERIHAKILDGKDRYRYFRLLSQVAYLEDLVNNWAYTFHSSQADNQLTASNTKRSSLESHLKDDNATSSANPSILATDSKADNAASTTKPSIMESKSKDDNSSGSSDADINLCMQGVSEKSCNEVQDEPNGGNTFATNTGGYINSSKGFDSSLLDSDISVIPEVRGFHDPSPFSSLSANLYSNSSLHRTASVHEGDSFLSEVVTPLEKQDHATEPIGSGLPETNIPSDSTMLNFDSSVLIPKACRDVDDDLKNAPSSCNAAYNSDEAVPSCDLILRKMKDLPDSEISCLYGCCSQCMHTLLMLIRDMLSDQWISTGCQLTVDDIHDAVASCSSNLLRKIRSYFDRLSSSTSVEHCFGRRECRTEPENCAWLEIGNHSPKGKLFQHNSSRKIQLLATECNYHQRNLEDIEKAPDKSGCLCQPPVKFFFRGGVLLPASPPEGAKFHCKHENLCVCLIVEIILMFKQSSNRTCTYGA